MQYYYAVYIISVCVCRVHNWVYKRGAEEQAFTGG